MIVDILENIGFYGVPAEGLEDALDWLSENDVLALEPGRYPLGNSGATAILALAQTVPADEEEWEAHRRFADLQVVLSGEEVMGFAPLSSMTPRGGYSPEDDCLLLEGGGNFLHVRPGTFVFFTPHDAHKALLNPPSGPSKVRKVVFKLPWKG